MLNDPTDPFSRQKLTMEMVKPCEELKMKIEQYKREKQLEKISKQHGGAIAKPAAAPEPAAVPANSEPAQVPVNSAPANSDPSPANSSPVNPAPAANASSPPSSAA